MYFTVHLDLILGNNETLGKAKSVILVNKSRASQEFMQITIACALSKFRLSRLSVMLFSWTLLTSNNKISFHKEFFRSTLRERSLFEEMKPLYQSKVKGTFLWYENRGKSFRKMQIKSRVVSSPHYSLKTTSDTFVKLKSLLVYWNHTQPLKTKIWNHYYKNP